MAFAAEVLIAIKPDNVLLSHGTAVVTDFGITKALSASRTQGETSRAIPLSTRYARARASPQCSGDSSWTSDCSPGRGAAGRSEERSSEPSRPNPQLLATLTLEW